MQFTAPVSPGSSGGALVNLKGEVVGMTTGDITASQNLNFAVASTMLSNFINPPLRLFTKSYPKEKALSEIPLPDVKGFFVHKWGCDLESVAKYFSPVLVNTYGSFDTISLAGTYKIFSSQIETAVQYHFFDEKLSSVEFNIKDNRDKAWLETNITKILSEIYASSPKNEYYDDGAIVLKCYPHGLMVAVYYNAGGNNLSLYFRPRK